MASGASSGAEIQKQIIADGVGRYIKYSTIYDDLRRLEDAGYIEYLGLRGKEKYFTLTGKGQKTLEREVKLLRILVGAAYERRL